MQLVVTIEVETDEDHLDSTNRSYVMRRAQKKFLLATDQLNQELEGIDVTMTSIKLED